MHVDATSEVVRLILDVHLTSVSSTRRRGVGDPVSTPVVTTSSASRIVLSESNAPEMNPFHVSLTSFG
ncbi:hypothetical protein Trydic_g14276 [Trypoxylus dichotomus]